MHLGLPRLALLFLFTWNGAISSPLTLSTDSSNLQIAANGSANPFPPWSGPTFDDLVQSGLDTLHKKYPFATPFDVHAEPLRSSGSYTNPKRFLVILLTTWTEQTRQVVRIKNSIDKPEEWLSPVPGEFVRYIPTFEWHRRGCTLERAFAILKDSQELKAVESVTLQDQYAPDGATKNQAYFIFKFREAQGKDIWIGALDRSIYPGPSEDMASGLQLVNTTSEVPSQLVGSVGTS